MVNLSKKQLSLMGGVGLVIILVIGYYLYSRNSQEDYKNIDTIQENVIQQEKTEEEVEEIVVHMAGQVNKSGIIRTKEGARIADIIEAAGGVTQEAELKNVNLAYIVEDGQKIIIPSKKEVREEEEYISIESGNNVIQEKNPREDTGGNSIININKAEQTQLEQLPGIGPSTALKIIEYRKENGNFKTIEDIKNVPGIGDAKFESMKENISIK